MYVPLLKIQTQIVFHTCLDKHMSKSLVFFFFHLLATRKQPRLFYLFALVGCCYCCRYIRNVFPLNFPAANDGRERNNKNNKHERQKRREKKKHIQ